MRTSVKSKGAALALAIFLGPFTWLYTYETDSWKFWVGLGLDVLATVFFLFLTVLTPIIWFLVWVWSIVDVVVRPQSFYDHYRR